MSVISVEFILFVIVLFFIYWNIPAKFQWILLLIASVIFYVFNSPAFTLVYVAFSVITVYFATQYFEKSNRHKKHVLIIALIVTLGSLVALKYTNTLMEALLIIGNVQGPRVNLVAPLAISFFTLQLVAYLLDCYWGTIKAVGKSRKQGYITALQNAGLNVDEKLSFEMGFSEDAGYKAGKYFSTLKKKPTAICCANDIVAMGVLTALYEEGIVVPDDISIVGMDDIIYSRISRPPLTSVSNVSNVFARSAFSMLFERIENTYEGEPREIIVERNLIIRESVSTNKCN